MTWPAYPPPHADAHGYDRVMDDRAVADPYAGWDDEDETSETAAPQTTRRPLNTPTTPDWSTMSSSTLQDQPTEPRRVRFTDALGEVTEGELVQVTDFAVLIKTKVGRVARWTGGRFDLIPLAGGFKYEAA